MGRKAHQTTTSTHIMVGYSEQAANRASELPLYLQQDLRTKYEREEQLVFLKQRTTDVCIETIREVLGQIA